MIIRIWYQENNETYRCDLKHLRPRLYMCGWSFKKLLKYLSNELEWEDIEKNSVKVITFIEKGQWECSVRKEQGE